MREELVALAKLAEMDDSARDIDAELKQIPEQLEELRNSVQMLENLPFSGITTVVGVALVLVLGLPERADRDSVLDDLVDLGRLLGAQYGERGLRRALEDMERMRMNVAAE